MDKKLIGKITEDTIDEWLHSTGFLFPKNELQLERFNKLYEDYDFKLKNTKIDIDFIINGNCSFKSKDEILKMPQVNETEIEELKMVARKGQSKIPQHIIEKMKKKHKKDNDDTE